MHCAAIAEDRIVALLAISAAHRSNPFTSAQRALQRQAVELGERLGSPEAGVALARKLAILTYRTPEEFGERFAAPSAIEGGRVRASSEPYLDHMSSVIGFSENLRMEMAVPRSESGGMITLTRLPS